MTSAIQTDAYKLSHHKFMHSGTTQIYNNLTARSGVHAKYLKDYDNQVVSFGFQKVFKEFLIDDWNANFFHQPKSKVIKKLKRRVDTYLGKNAVAMEHFEQLHDLGYLPLEIKVIPEGSLVPFKVPLMTMKNTHNDFAWLTNYLETVLSCELWHGITNATTAFQYRKLCEKFAHKTVGNTLHIPFQCHDFSFRGMMGRHAAALSGAAHLLSFNGTDTIPAIDLLEDYYHANAETEFIAASVPASEHSVTSLGISVDGEFETIKRWITEDYPTGIVSLVADTFDYWKVITEYIPALKDIILARPANEMGLSKIVCRPDSGNPVDIICGTAQIHNLGRCASLEEAKDWAKDILCDRVADETPHGEYGDEEPEGFFSYEGKIYKAKAWIEYNRYDKQFYYQDGSRLMYFEEAELTPEEKGSIQLLWEIFGGTISDMGYKVLDSHIGLIYGDSITLERANEIFERLEAKGFASSNVIYGIGSFSYAYRTRDSLGMAVKATAAIVDGEYKELFKDPKTDTGAKKSARGYLRVEFEDDKFVLYDQQTPEQESQGCLETVFLNSKMVKETNLSEIRERLAAHL